MEMNGVIQIIKPVPDSQYRLKACRCHSDNVAYVQKTDDLWYVRCFDCGQVTGHGLEIRHDIQQVWNGGDYGKQVS